MTTAELALCELHRRGCSSEMTLNYRNQASYTRWYAQSPPQKVHDSLKLGKELFENLRDNWNLDTPEPNARAAVTAKLTGFVLRTQIHVIPPFCFVCERTVRNDKNIYQYWCEVLGNQRKRVTNTTVRPKRRSNYSIGAFSPSLQRHCHVRPHARVHK